MINKSFRYSKAEIKAKSLLQYCGLDDPSEIDISEVILGRGAFYEEKPLFGKEGEIVSFGGKSIITINSNIQVESKKRFAAAHELGHYELHRGLTPIQFDTEYDLLNWYKSGPQEAEANDFASEFLMPSEIFYNECKSKRFGPHVIDHLASRFNVSKTAAILKFVKRGTHPVCIVFCKDNKMKWFKASEDFRGFLDFERDIQPPTGTVAYEVFNKKIAYFDEERRQQIWKSDWFRINETDPIFYEYCLYAKSYNYTISIIWED